MNPTMSPLTPHTPGFGPARTRHRPCQGPGWSFPLPLGWGSPAAREEGPPTGGEWIKPSRSAEKVPDPDRAVQSGRASHRGGRMPPVRDLKSEGDRSGYT